LSQLPTVVDVRTSSNLINDIVKNCDNRLSITNISNSEFKTQGNHKYLLMMFRILVNYVPKEYEKIICELFHNNSSTEALGLIFNIGLQSNQFSFSDKNKLEISCALLNKIGKFYNMSVTLEYAGDELSNIRVSWEEV
jgi:two-component system response regulator HupR/HoxA